MTLHFVQPDWMHLYMHNFLYLHLIEVRRRAHDPAVHPIPGGPQMMPPAPSFSCAAQSSKDDRLELILDEDLIVWVTAQAKVHRTSRAQAVKAILQQMRGKLTAP